jgi:FtsZ-binding cell division protein ZapB
VAKVKVNERGFEALNLEIKQLKREKSDLYNEIDALRSQRMMLFDTVSALVEDKSYWSEEAQKSGIIWRLENVLKNIQ